MWSKNTCDLTFVEVLYEKETTSMMPLPKDVATVAVKKLHAKIENGNPNTDGDQETLWPTLNIWSHSGEKETTLRKGIVRCFEEFSRISKIAAVWK